MLIINIIILTDLYSIVKS